MDEQAAIKPEPKKSRFKALKVVLAVFLPLFFVISVAVAILYGGELIEEPTVEYGTKGLIRLDSPNYQQSYFTGDTFSFDKEKNKVRVVARDPSLENIVNNEDMPADEYGFVIRKYYSEDGVLTAKEDIEDNASIKPIYEKENDLALEKEAASADTSNEGNTDEATASDENTSTEETEDVKNYYYVDSEFYLNAEDITMTPNMGTICLASKRYQDLTLELDTSVVNGYIDESKLSNTVLLEAENQDVYKDDVLLTREQLATMPDNNKPFLSSEGQTIDGKDCSGGACLRSFNTNNMKVDFEIVTSQAATVNLTMLVCQRPQGDVFSNYFKVSLNGSEVDVLDDIEVPGAGSGYYTPYTMPSVQIELQKGVNHLIFTSGPNAGTGSPCNLDAVSLSTLDENLNILGDSSAIVLNEEE